jgi:hypothetical protein
MPPASPDFSSKHKKENAVNLDELTIGEARQLAAMFGGEKKEPCHPATGKFVVVRCYAAGVHVGILHSADGKSVHLTRARRIWKWTGGALSCSEIAMSGITGGKLAVEVPDIFLLDALEIITGTAGAEKCLRDL